MVADKKNSGCIGRIVWITRFFLCARIYLCPPPYYADWNNPILCGFLYKKCTMVFSVTIVANIFRAFPRTLETFWWVTGHPGWVLGHIQRSCTRRIMFLTMFYSPPCSKSMLGTFAQVVEKMKSSLVTTRKNMDLSVKWGNVPKYSNRPLNWAYASFDL